jgi:hypothetical protein
MSDQLEHIEKTGHLEDLEPAERVPTVAEMEAAIRKLKNNKAPGMDLIQAEMIRNAGTEYFKHLHHLIVKTWLTETIPEEWNLSIIFPIHKKGDVTICTNYRGISFLCITYKKISNILFQRLSPYVENIIGDYQCGFRQGISTSEQIFNIRQILEKCSEFGIEAHHLFIDFKAAYDSIDR